MEASILIALQALRLPGLTQIAALVSAFGNYAFIWLVIAIVMLFYAERRHVGVSLVLAIVLTGIIVGFIIQPLVGRIRPYDAGIGVSAVMGVSRTGFSFPSFHAATSFAAAAVLASSLGRRVGIPACIGAVLIALSRMYLGVEYPTDVLGGIVIGVLVGLGSTWLYNQFLHDIVRDHVGMASGRNKRKSVGEPVRKPPARKRAR